MRGTWLKWSQLWCCLFIIGSVAAVAKADSRRRSVSGEFGDIDALFSRSSRSALVGQASHSHMQLADPIRFSGTLAGMGRFRGSLNTQRMTAETDYVLLQGEAKLLGKSFGDYVPSFGTLIRTKKGTYVLRLFLPTARRSRPGQQRLSEFRMRLKKEGARFHASTVSRSRSHKKMEEKGACGSPHAAGAHHEHASHRSSRRVGLTTQATLQEVELAVDADTEYANRIGTDLGQELNTVVNAVDTIYRRDLALTFSSNINTTPQTYSTSISLDENFAFPIHEEMAQKVDPNSRDMHVLLTGKDPVGSEIANLAGAVPALGTVCKQPSLSVGFTIRWQDGNFSANIQDDILTTAHEVGHSFNAEHDDNETSVDNRGIMHSGTTSVNNEITAFSQYSMNQVSSYVSSLGEVQCLTTTEGDRGTDSTPGDDGGNTNPDDSGGDDSDDSVATPTIELGFIRAKRRGKRNMRFFSFDTEGFRLDSVELEILCRESSFDDFISQGIGTTNRRGVLRVRGIPGIQCIAQNGSIVSNIVKLPRRRRRRRKN